MVHRQFAEHHDRQRQRQQLRPDGPWPRQRMPLAREGNVHRWRQQRLVGLADLPHGFVRNAFRQHHCRKRYDTLPDSSQRLLQLHLHADDIHSRPDRPARAGHQDCLQLFVDKRPRQQGQCDHIYGPHEHEQLHQQQLEQPASAISVHGGLQRSAQLHGRMERDSARYAVRLQRNGQPCCGNR